MTESLSPLALRPQQAAKLLGISTRTLYQWTKDGRIPCVRVGNGKHSLVLYPVSLLHAWLTEAAAHGQKRLSEERADDER